MGRRPKSKHIRINWLYIDRIMVYGEIFRHPDNVKPERMVWPTHRQMAGRLHCSKTTIDIHRQRGAWHEKRKKIREEYGEDALFEMARRESRLWPLEGEAEPGLHVFGNSDPGPESATATNEYEDKPWKQLSSFEPSLREKAIMSTGLLPLEMMTCVDDQVEHLLVHGELKEASDKQYDIVYPTFVQVAKRLNLTVKQVKSIAKKAKIEERKADAAEKYRKMADEAVVAARSTAIENYRSKVSLIASEYVDQYLNNLKEGRIVADSAVDLDRLVKLVELINGGVTDRHEVTGMPTIDQLSIEYQRLRDSDSAVPNVITDESDPLTGFTSTVH